MKLRDRLVAFLSPGNLTALALLGACVGLLFWLRSTAGAELFSPEGLTSFVTDLGWRGVLIYICILVISVVLSQIPGVPLAVAAGMIWGPWLGTLYSVAGGFLGGLIAYYLGRTLGRSLVKAITGKAFRFTEQRGERYLAVVVFVTRLLPVLSFDLVSYASGMSGLSVRLYAVATFFGMIPSTLLLTTLGSRLVLGGPAAFLLSLVAALLILGLPFGVKRWNWLGLRELVRAE